MFLIIALPIIFVVGVLCVKYQPQLEHFLFDNTTEIGDGSKKDLSKYIDTSKMQPYSAEDNLEDHNNNSETQSYSSEDNPEDLTNNSETQVYPADMIGRTVGEMIDTLGQPTKAERGYLGGGGNDTGYIYDEGCIAYVTLFASADDFYFDDRDAFINVVCVYKGALNENINVGMSYNELNEIYSLGELEESVLDGRYRASTSIILNGVNCTLIAECLDGNKDSPINSFTIYAQDITN